MFFLEPGEWMAESLHRDYSLAFLDSKLARHPGRRLLLGFRHPTSLTYGFLRLSGLGSWRCHLGFLGSGQASCTWHGRRAEAAVLLQQTELLSKLDWDAETFWDLAHPGEDCISLGSSQSLCDLLLGKPSGEQMIRTRRHLDFKPDRRSLCQITGLVTLPFLAQV